MKSKVACTWLDNMKFEAQVNDHALLMDADEAFGGTSSGPRPKDTLLATLAGCTGMDVISILKKMQQVPEKLTITVEAELTDEHPRYFNKIHLVYEIKGADLEPVKVERAVQLSQEKYCGVSAMLRFAADITYEIKYV